MLTKRIIIFTAVLFVVLVGLTGCDWGMKSDAPKATPLSNSEEEQRKAEEQKKQKEEEAAAKKKAEEEAAAKKKAEEEAAAKKKEEEAAAAKKDTSSDSGSSSDSSSSDSSSETTTTTPPATTDSDSSSGDTSSDSGGSSGDSAADLYGDLLKNYQDNPSGTQPAPTGNVTWQCTCPVQGLSQFFYSCASNDSDAAFSAWTNCNIQYGMYGDQCGTCTCVNSGAAC